MLHERTEKLKKQYLTDIKNFENAIDIGKTSMSIPKIISKYQFHYHDLLKRYSELQDELDDKMYDLFWNSKIGNHELSNISLSDSTLRKAITETKEYRNIKSEQDNIKNDLKIVEEMIDTIKNFNFNINNTLKFKQMIGES